MTGPLVTTAWLEERLGDPGTVVVEVAHHPPLAAAYFSGHIPGARYRHWKALCWHETMRAFPSPEAMAARLGELGVGDDTTLAIVGDTLQFGIYAYWVLEMTGLSHLAVVLDGGHRTWEEEGRPMTNAVPEPATPALPTIGRPDETSRIGRDGVLAGLRDPERVLLDMRSDEEWRGERVAPTTAPHDHGAERSGRIPGARHLNYERLLRDDGTFKDREGLLVELTREGVEPHRDIVTYCRLSHRASLAWFVLTKVLGGYPQVRVYDGSWTEWGSIVGTPIER